MNCTIEHKNFFFLLLHSCLRLLEAWRSSCTSHAAGMGHHGMRMQKDWWMMHDLQCAQAARPSAHVALHMAGICSNEPWQSSNHSIFCRATRCCCGPQASSSTVLLYTSCVSKVCSNWDCTLYVVSDLAAVACRLAVGCLLGKAHCVCCCQSLQKS